MGRGEGFAEAFPGETEGSLDALRELFRRKALVARESRIAEALLATGETPDEITGRRVADLPDDPGARRCIELREQLGLDADDAAPGFILPDGEPIAPGDLRRWLRIARLMRTSLEVNGGLCRSLLRVRYDIADSEEVAA